MGMVLKYNIQKRVGSLFFIFSSIILVWSIIKGLSYGDFYEIFTLRNLSIFIYFLVFGLSILYKNPIFGFLQVLCIGIEGLLTVAIDLEYYYFGLIFIFIAIMLSYIYEYFKKYKILKSILLSGILVYFFFTFSLQGTETPFISSLMWLLFLWIILLLFWFIFKDYIKEYQNQKEQWEQSLEKLQNKIEEYAEISHLSLNTNKELLEIIKNHRIGAYDD